jgi:hypothetical protein
MNSAATQTKQYYLFRYGIKDAWWCYYKDLSAACKKEADRLMMEYLLEGGQLDVFITSHISQQDFEKIKTQLMNTMTQSSKDCQKIVTTFQNALEEACAQDLYEKGVPRDSSPSLLPLLVIDIHPYNIMYAPCVLCRNTT